MKTAENPPEPLWIFGYGSLIWRPDFPYSEQRNGFIRNYARRFWQGSTDHRGSVQSPGRVVTLIDEPGSVCWGTAYRVRAEDEGDTLGNLDQRERGGFRREWVDVHVKEGGRGVNIFRAQLYLAPPENPMYLGPDPLSSMAEQICSAMGPSGSNVEYVLKLAEALRRMGAEDDHVFSLESLIRERKS